ncbi:MAG: hypothetical protein AMXMBFR53_39440 [Gemmatimonadota bacterium]
MNFEFLIPIFGILLVLVPVTGVTVILTARFATKPIVEALMQLRGANVGSPGQQQLQLQVQDLAETVEVLTDEVRRLREAQAFDHKLLQEKTAAKP